jgi:DNA-binding transcriptional MerR regulator
MKYYVSDVARILGLTPGALHFFESKDIINAKKEDNGYRYYDEEDVFRLLSYFKYHSMGIPLKDIGRHFSGKERDRNRVIERIRQNRDELVQKIAYYQHLCELIGDYLTGCERISTLLNNYEFAQSPKLIFMHFGQNGWISAEKYQQKYIHKWVDAMPATHLSVFCTGWKNETDESTAVLGYSIRPEEAEKLNLPFDKGKMVSLHSLPCYHTIVTADSDFAYFPGKVFHKTLEAIRERNLVPSSAPFGNVLLVDVDSNTTHPIVELWCPIH